MKIKCSPKVLVRALLWVSPSMTDLHVSCYKTRGFSKTNTVIRQTKFKYTL